MNTVTRALRPLGEVTSLYLSQGYGVVRVDLKDVELVEISGKKAELTGPGTAVLDRGWDGGKVNGIFYKLADDRAGIGTKGREAGHIFGDGTGQYPRLVKTASGWKLEGDAYWVGPEGLRG